MTNAKEITGFVNLLTIAQKAIDAHDAETRRKMAREALDDAYVCWKQNNGIDRVERDTMDWTRMMGATAVAYDVLEDTKRDERNARRRLSTAVLRYQEGGAA